MDNKNILIGTSILLLVILFFSGFFKPTGFAVNDTGFASNITGLVVNEDQKLLVSLDIPPAQQKIEAGQNLLLEIAIIKQKADSLGERLDKVKSIKDQLTEV